MDSKLKELLHSINSRFSGPNSCRLNDMIIGRLDLDYDEIESYLNKLKDFGGIQSDQIIQKNQKDAKAFLVLYTEYRNSNNL
jgi:hypothetical protein